MFWQPTSAATLPPDGHRRTSDRVRCRGGRGRLAHDGLARAQRQGPGRCAHACARDRRGQADRLPREPDRAEPALGPHRHPRPRPADDRHRRPSQRGARPRLLHPPRRRGRRGGRRARARAPPPPAAAAGRRPPPPPARAPPPPPPPPLRQVAALRDLPVDGGIVVDPNANDPSLALFDALGLPLVTVERDPARPGADWFVASDNAANTRTVLDHLAAHGARRIALLAPETTAAWVSETRETYAAWTAEHDREPIIVSVAHERLEGSAYTSTAELLDRPDRPDAVYAVSEPYATGALRAARERGLGVPDALLLVAGVDSHEASAGDPPITALDLHPDEQAANAVELLVARVGGRPADVPRMVPGTLCVRRSSARDAAA